MRLRNVPGSRQVIAESEYVIQEPKQWKGKWKQIFGNDNPIYIEIGMGKGKFILSMAERYPKINFIGIEKYSSVLLRAIERRYEFSGDNLTFIRMDATEITEVFAKNEVSMVYLNFSDPWPKDRHAKRRLVSRQFLERYDAFLMPKGKVVFKTDNSDLFEFAMNEVPEAGWNMVNYTHDLLNSEFAKDNVMTEYEEKFVKEGKAICKMEIHRVPKICGIDG